MRAFLIFALLFFVLQLPLTPNARTIAAGLGVVLFAVFLIFNLVGVGVLR